MSESQINFVKQKFIEYYRDNIEGIQPPSSIEKREFGFHLFKNNIMIRHKGFQSEETFRKFLVSSAPSDVYYSSAYYEKPQEPMERKGWTGSDLIFDIDADHIETPCDESHEYWLCETCSNAGTGTQPRECPRCKGVKFKKEAWLCESCLEAAKVETLKLIDFLTDDFGFHPNEVEVCFSGHRGYHAHVARTEIHQLDQAARREIVDYITGTGLVIERHGLIDVKDRSGRGLIGPDLNDPGWGGRMAKGVYGLLSSLTPQQLEQLPGIGKSASKALAANREVILEKWNRRTPWSTVPGIGIKTWKKIIQPSIKDQAAGIDTVVTTDTHRLIRLPLSLHGKTGLIAINIPLGSLERFDPLKEAIAFKKGVLKVFITQAHRFRIGNEEFGPYEEEAIELPLAAAIYLLCKRAAVPSS